MWLCGTSSWLYGSLGAKQVQLGACHGQAAALKAPAGVKQTQVT
jgi:hypothetical protein